MSKPRKKAEELAEQVLDTLSVWGNRSGETKREKMLPIFTAALEAERKEAIKEADKWMRHLRGCDVNDPFYSLPCTCGLSEFKGEK
jgi:hypothetical protein